VPFLRNYSHTKLLIVAIITVTNGSKGNLEPILPAYYKSLDSLWNTKSAMVYILNATKIFETLSGETRAINITTTLYCQTLNKWILQLYFSDWQLVVCLLLYRLFLKFCLPQYTRKSNTKLEENFYFEKAYIWCTIEEQIFWCRTCFTFKNFAIAAFMCHNLQNTN